MVDSPKRICAMFLPDRADNGRVVGVCFEDIPDVEMQHHRVKYIRRDLIPWERVEVLLEAIETDPALEISGEFAEIFRDILEARQG